MLELGGIVALVWYVVAVMKRKTRFELWQSRTTDWLDEIEREEGHVSRGMRT